MPDPLFQRIADLLAQNTLDALALLPGQTLTYLTGLHFHLSERPVTLLINAEKALLILPELEAGKVAQSTLPLEFVTFGDNPSLWQAAFDRAIQVMGLDGKKIGVESIHMRFQELKLLQKSTPTAKIIAGDSALTSLRIFKNPVEVEKMRKAVKIAEEALLLTLPFIRPGVSEQQISNELSINLLRAGATAGPSFESIIAAGPNAANPHAGASDRLLQTGDLLIIDWGATYHDYISDLTRTFAIGTVDPELAQIAEIVRQANQAGCRAVRPGIPAGSVDAATRGVIQAAGYGEYFIHRTGHGIGMEVHEPPYIFGENLLLLEPGMAFTIEPGIYLPGRGGVRIEDNVVVTGQGCEILSSLPRELITLPLKR